VVQYILNASSRREMLYFPPPLVLNNKFVYERNFGKNSI
jgi:hypothetical protein